jgi:MFS family permease
MRLALLRPLGSRDFSLLWTGMAISLLGDGIYFVAIAWQVLRISDGPTALSVVGIAWTLPQVLFLLIGGVLSDRIDRRKVLIGADVARAVVMAGLGFLSLAGEIQLWQVIVLVALYGAADAFFMPAFGAIVPDVVPADMLVEANSLDQFVRPIALRLIGPGVGGLIVAAWSPGGAFLLNAASFAFSGACVLAMRHRPRVEPRSSEARHSLWQEVREGLVFVRAHTWLWGTLIATAVALLCFFGPQTVLVPIIVKTNLGGGAWDYGLILAIGGVGSIVASLAIAQAGQPRRHVTFMYLCWSMGTFVIAYYAIVTQPWQAMLASFSIGVTFTAGLIIWSTLMHRHVPPELLGRVSSLDWLVSSGLTPISFALTGPVALAVGNEAALAGAGVLGGTVVLAFLALPGLRAIEAGTGRRTSRQVVSE